MSFSGYDLATNHFVSSPAFHRVSAVRYVFSLFFAFSASLRLIFFRRGSAALRVSIRG
jgi:hypothetical protein